MEISYKITHEQSAGANAIWFAEDKLRRLRIVYELERRWAVKGSLTSVPLKDVRHRSNYKRVGIVADASGVADPKKKNQLRFFEENRISMASFDEIFRHPEHSHIPIAGCLVQVKFYQKSHRYRDEEGAGYVQK